jgi:hypothetical protein
MGNPESSRLFYHGTSDEVCLGDRVRLRRWIRRPLEGVVCYIPGLSPIHREIGADQWAIRLADGSLSVTVYSPTQAQPRPHIELVARGAAPPAIDPAKRLEDWWEPEDGQEEEEEGRGSGPSGR